MNTRSDFHDVRFPLDIALASSGGPERSTEIVTLGSGREERNQRWRDSRRRFDAGYGVKDLDALHAVVAFYEARRGPLYAFRFRDPLDWKSALPTHAVHHSDQAIGYGDGAQTRFKLTKVYGEGAHAYHREIACPVVSSLTVAVDDVPLDETDFDFDFLTGEIVLGNDATPATNALVTAGFEFDVPVRFVSDELIVSLAAFTAGEIPSIPLLETRL